MGKHSWSGSAHGRCLCSLRKPGGSKDLISILVKASHRETPKFRFARRELASVKTTDCWKCASKVLDALVEERRRRGRGGGNSQVRGPRAQTCFSIDGKVA